VVIRGTLGASVAASLQISVQILEAVPAGAVLQAPIAGAVLQAPIAAAIDPKSALDDQPTRRFCWMWVCPCVTGPASDDDRQTRSHQRICAAIARARATTMGKTWPPA
jgi:hypothetical protein